MIAKARLISVIKLVTMRLVIIKLMIISFQKEKIIKKTFMPGKTISYLGFLIPGARLIFIKLR